MPHLSYIGDAEVGEGTNIGAGAITANYRTSRAGEGTHDDRAKRQDGHSQWLRGSCDDRRRAWIGGGSYITEDVPPESLAVARARQVTKEGYLRGKRND